MSKIWSSDQKDVVWRARGRKWSRRYRSLWTHRLWKRALYGIDSQGFSMLIEWMHLEKQSWRVGGWRCSKEKSNVRSSKKENKNIILTHNHPVSHEWSLSIFPLGKIKAQIPPLELGFLEELKAWPGLDYILCSFVCQVLWHKWLGSRVCCCFLRVGLPHRRFLRLVQQEVSTVCRMLLSYF